MNHLVCVLSTNVSVQSQVPTDQCTHLVYREVDWDEKAATFQPLKNGSASKQDSNVHVHVQMFMLHLILSHTVHCSSALPRHEV